MGGKRCAPSSFALSEPRSDKRGQPIDFNAVERDLIDPALTALGIAGRTTLKIAAAGNIREDMFRMLIASDLVIADISIHNANVFYELGIRHALRPWRTYMIRCKADDTVFDLSTDRYLEYERDRPGDSLAALVEGLHQTLAEERKDSPVYLLLPRLPVQPRLGAGAGAAGFRRGGGAGEAREAARRPRAAGRGGARLRVGDRGPARGWAGAVRDGRPRGCAGHLGGRARHRRRQRPRANTLLATIYQKLGDLVASDLALERALDEREAGGATYRAELLSLGGTKCQSRWQPEWSAAGDESRARGTASAWLEHSAEAYEAGLRRGSQPLLLGP